jgi:hypothetical protein
LLYQLQITVGSTVGSSFLMHCRDVLLLVVSCDIHVVK